MNGLLWHRALCAVATLVLLTGCGSLAPAPPGASQADPVLPQLHSVRPNPSNTSWIQPQKKKSALLYISYFGGVNIYSYPGLQQVGQLTGFESPEALCSDKAGNVFVTDTEAQAVYEYAHGGTQRIATLFDNYAEFNAFGCSVDLTTNTLAVTSADSNDVFLFPNETGTPTIYNNPYSYGYFCTYDGAGNLFTRGTNYHIAELPRGASQFSNIPLSQSVGDLVGFAWDGKYLSINSDAPANVNYRVRVRGMKGTIISKAALEGAKLVMQFTLFNKRLIGPDQNANEVSFWTYPKGGNPVKAISAIEAPQGSTISMAQ